MKLLDRALVVITTTLAALAVASLARTGSLLLSLYGPPRPDSTIVGWGVLVPGAPRFGPEDATIRIVEFIDYGCGACRGYQSTLDEVLKRFPFDVSVTIRNFPRVGPSSREAARASLCAWRQGAFQEFHRLLLSEDFLSAESWEETLIQYGSRARVPDGIEFLRCMDSQAIQEALETDSILASEIGINSTPTLVVNGQVYVGAEKRLAEIVEKLLASDLRS
jgi:protein-disulfide isomerase